MADSTFKSKRARNKCYNNQILFGRLSLLGVGDV